jgi:hypothetical protein
MFMFKGGRKYGLTNKDREEGDLPCHLNYWYPGQVGSTI